MLLAGWELTAAQVREQISRAKAPCERARWHALWFWRSEGPLRRWLIPTGVLTSKPEMREVGHGTQLLRDGLKLPEAVTEAGHHLIES